MIRLFAPSPPTSRTAALFVIAWLVACASLPVGARAERAATVVASAEIVEPLALGAPEVVHIGRHRAAATFALGGLDHLAYQVVLPERATARSSTGSSATIELSIDDDSLLVLGGGDDRVALDAELIVPEGGLAPGSYEASVMLAVAYQ